MANLVSSSSSGGQSELPSIRDDQNIAHSPASPDRSIGESSDHLAIAGNEPDVVDPLILTSGVITPELDALEAVLANDADEISALLNLPFSSLLARVQDLGFDAALLLEELRALGLIRADLWLTPVQLDQAEFLALTPLQYSELFPESGAPLVFAVLKAIRLSDEQAQLLATAGGTNLSKSDKIQIGVAVSLGFGYLLPKLYFHERNKAELVKEWEAKVEGKDPGTKGAFEKVNELVTRVDEEGFTVKLTKGVVQDRMDLVFDTYGGRLLYELRSTLPGNAVQRIWNTGALQRLGEWIKKKLSISESEAIDDSFKSSVAEDSILSADDAEALLIHAGDGRQAQINVDRAIEDPIRELEDAESFLELHGLEWSDIAKYSHNLNLKSLVDSMLTQQVQEVMKQNFVSNLDAFQKEDIHLEDQLVENMISNASSVVAEKVDDAMASIEQEAEDIVVEEIDAEQALLVGEATKVVSAAEEDVETKV